MAYSYPISLPDTPKARAITSRAFARVATASSPFTESEDVQVYDGQRLVWDVELPPIVDDRVSAGLWEAAMLKLNGLQGTCLYGDVTRSAPEGAYSAGLDTPLIDSSASPQPNLRGNTSIVTTGWRANGRNLLLPGDWIQLGSGATARLHKVLTAVDSDGAGDATIDIWPRLRRTLNDAEPLTMTDTVGLWRLGDNAMPHDIQLGLVYGFRFTLIEAAF